LVALSLGLMFMRIDLYGVNSIAYGASHWVTFLWSTVIFVTAMKGVSKITKSNYPIAMINLIFLVLQKDVDPPRCLSTLAHLSSSSSNFPK
jgi:hypothetical protein